MQNRNLISEYTNEVNQLKENAKRLDVSEAEIERIFRKSFDKLRDQSHTKKNSHTVIKTVLKTTVALTTISLIIYILLNVHQPTSSIVLRNIQGLIYPGFKILRFLSVPIIRRFPSLTELYDETCLIENPYFYVSDMECWPCEHVHSVIDLSGFNNISLYQSGVPYVVQTNQKPITFTKLKDLYQSNKEVFDTDASRIKSTNSSIKTAQELFASTTNGSMHSVWRINRMRPARLIRSMFIKPIMVPEWSGQSIERFIMIDGPFANAYALPNPECSYVFLIQGSGERTVILKPSRECANSCKTVSIVLKPNYVLWYNWWYWRPISLPVENSTDVSISYMSCYC